MRCGGDWGFVGGEWVKGGGKGEVEPQGRRTWWDIEKGGVCGALLD